MIGLAELPELIREHEAGEILWRDVYPVLAELLVDHDVDRILRELTPELSGLFVDELRRSLDNTVPVEDTIWIGGVENQEMRAAIVARARAWLSRTAAR